MVWTHCYQPLAKSRHRHPVQPTADYPVGFNLIQPSVSGNLYLNIELPDAFVHGDGLGVKYVSKLIYLWSTDQKPLQQRKKELQEQSCLELLCYLVVSAPARVRLHPSCFKGGKEKVQEFQMKAVDLATSIRFGERSLAWQIPEVHAGQPLVATVNIGSAVSPVPPSCQEPPAVGSTGRPGVGGHTAVLGALRGLQTNKVYLTTLIPWNVATKLRDLLPKEEGRFAAIFVAVS